MYFYFKKWFTYFYFMCIHFMMVSVCKLETDWRHLGSRNLNQGHYIHQTGLRASLQGTSLISNWWREGLPCCGQCRPWASKNSSWVRRSSVLPPFCFSSYLELLPQFLSVMNASQKCPTKLNPLLPKEENSWHSDSTSLTPNSCRKGLIFPESSLSPLRQSASLIRCRAGHPPTTATSCVVHHACRQKMALPSYVPFIYISLCVDTKITLFLAVLA